MLTKLEQLKSRGQLPDGIPSNYRHSSFSEKIKLLNSKIATERTLAARLLKTNKTDETISLLINALTIENKLYTKIEICNTLSSFNELAIPPLINCLGKIGHNQHKTIPEKAFLKDSYPLPRDIASRTLIRIGKPAIPKLLEALDTNDKSILSELIDTIGHINFNTNITNLYEPLKTCFNTNEKDNLIQWKIIRAFSGIPESKAFLNTLLTRVNHERLRIEIQRSLRLIEK